ncbi:MAG TPA: hypothetical protein VG406_15260 [Isosphaeraceae bacterium]|jgi:hypothetical protein|nr:hypothetical protein [Isosphaeraceae bacterium]
MADGGRPGMDRAELAAALKAADAAAFLVPARVLRRVIRGDRGLRWVGLSVPHRAGYVIDRAAALNLLDRDELGLGPGEDPPPTLILLAEPEPEDLATTPRDAMLLRYWRALFHAGVHAALGRRFAAGLISPAALRERIARIGPTEFDEARHVLRADGDLLPPRDDRGAFEEFAARYLELRSFAPASLPDVFPGLRDVEAVDAVLGEDLDAGGILATSRPPGAPEPVFEPAREDEEDEPEPEPYPVEPEGRSERQYWTLMRAAERAEGRGNAVRAAILRTKAARRAAPGHAGRARSEARDDLEGLARRLREAVGLDDAGTRAWRDALVPLLDGATRGFWTHEARLLYDLQKAALDHDRELFTVDLIEWALSFGRRPIRRPLPNQQYVLITKHLRAAARRLRSARLAEPDREALARLLVPALERAEEILRDRIRPLVARSLAEVGLRPADVPEQVAAGAIVEELLDKVVERGYLAMGDVRDALARNQLKLPDLAGPVEFVRGDRLLRLDRRLAVAIDGVYHRGEAYLRALQRLSALAFGTPLGRSLTLFFIIPFAGAFVLLEAVGHLIVLVGGLLHPHHAVAGQPKPPELDLARPLWVAVVGLVLLALIHVARFRRSALEGARLAWRGVRGVLIDAPSWLLGRRVVRRLIESRAMRALWRWGIEPLALTSPAWLLLPHGESHRRMNYSIAASSFLATSLLLNTRAGRRTEELVVDRLHAAWHRFGFEFIPGLFRLVMEFFNRLLEGVDRLLYSVDEWLRFRGGEGRLSLAAKAALGVGWFVVTYIVRFVVNLLVEPQINPIKHFPVVTVSHKIILPFLPRVAERLPLAPAEAKSAATLIVAAIPGAIGFLVWELKENWRLYAANRSPSLRPVMIGHHGETMVRLLRPGFHSGTLPKLFARLRRAERHPMRRGVGKARAALHHLEEGLLHYVERGPLATLRESRAFADSRIAAGAVEVATNRVEFELIDPDAPDAPARIAFEERSGWLVAGIAEAGWIARLEGDRRRAFEAALAGAYKAAGVDLVRESIEAALGPGAGPYDFDEDGLVLWPRGDYSVAARYRLRDDEDVLLPKTLGAEAMVRLPALEADLVRFGAAPIPWRRWVEFWEGERAGAAPPARFVEGFALLPTAERPALQPQPQGGE